MNRTPPKPVRQALRTEVGFGCPVANCNSPYLEWHHFDPPWSRRQHHDPGGMIALCSHHHRKADSGAFTNEQLTAMKLRGAGAVVQGRFDWMRRKLLTVAGGNFYYQVRIALELRGVPIVRFNRSSDGCVLLNAQFPNGATRRLQLEDNDWTAHGDTEDLECPPSGKLLHVKYPNKDRLKIEFSEIESAEELEEAFPVVKRHMWESTLEFPLTTVEIELEMPTQNLILNATHTNIGGGGVKGGYFSNVLAAVCG